MCILRDLIYMLKESKSSNEMDLCFKEVDLQSEKVLRNSLNDEQAKLFNDFKWDYFNHLQEAFCKNYEEYAQYGLQIGREIERFENRIYGLKN